MGRRGRARTKQADADPTLKKRPAAVATQDAGDAGPSLKRRPAAIAAAKPPKRTSLADILKAGNITVHVSRMAVKNLPTDIRDRLKNNLQSIDTVHVVSLMTGSGMDEPACAAAEASWKDEQLIDDSRTAIFRHLVKCEKEESKRNHLHRCFGNEFCMYADVSDFASWVPQCTRTKCENHGHIGLDHIVDNPDIQAVIVVSGCSCKDFSRLNNIARQRGISLKDMLDKGSSTTTLAATLRVIDLLEGLIIMVLLENVDTMDTGHDKKNSEAIVLHLAELSIHAIRFVANSFDYGLPQRRVRLFIAGYSTSNVMTRDTDPDEFDQIMVRVMEARCRVWNMG